MTTPHALAEELKGTRDWTLKLIADLEPEDWGFQPAPGLAHPIWLLGHMVVAEHSLIHQRCFDTKILDEMFVRHFGMGSTPTPIGEHDYPAVKEILSLMTSLHHKTIAAVRNISDDALLSAADGCGAGSHPHFEDKFGAIAHCNRHEAFHAGQIATIRRLRGKKYLR